MGRWIKLYAKLLSSKIFRNKDLVVIWIWCLLKASHEKCTVSLKVGNGIVNVDLKPGQFIFGRLRAAEDLQVTPSTLRNRLNKMEEQGYIKIYPHKTYSIIYIAKWHVYQPTQASDDVEIDGEIYTKKVTWVRKNSLNSGSKS